MNFFGDEQTPAAVSCVATLLAERDFFASLAAQQLATGAAGRLQQQDHPRTHPAHPQPDCCSTAPAKGLAGSETRLGNQPPTGLANRFEAYRPTEFALAVGDRVRVTAGGKTKDGKHRLNNGSLFTVQGINKRGDIAVDHGWIIDRDFGHLTHGYVVTSHASQGATVHKVFIGMSSESFPATSDRTAYVSVTRGRELAHIYTDDRQELLKAISRADDPLSATELAESTNHKPTVRDGLAKPLAFGRRQAALAAQQRAFQPGNGRNSTLERDMDHDR